MCILKHTKHNPKQPYFTLESTFRIPLVVNSKEMLKKLLSRLENTLTIAIETWFV